MNANPNRRDLLVSAACRPVVGRERIQRVLEGYLDGASVVLDQSLRGILGGKGPDGLRHLVRFPDYLNESPNNLQNYGEISTCAPAIHYQCIGWYDNDAANLKPVSPEDEARGIVPLMGGRDAVLGAAREALALEGKVTIPRIIPPAPEIIAASAVTYADHFRVRIDPDRSGETDSVLRFEFAEGGAAALHIRRAVAEFVAAPDDHYRPADVTLALSGEAWAKLYLSLASVQDLEASGEVTITGDPAEAARLIDIFDRHDPEKAVVVPPAAFSPQR